MFQKDANKPEGTQQSHCNICLLGMENGGKMRINNYVSPKQGLADTEANDGLGTQDQVQSPAPQVQKKGKVK